MESPRLKSLLSSKVSIRMYCFEGKDSFVPSDFLTVIKEHPKLQEAVSCHIHDAAETLASEVGAFRRAGVSS